MNTLLRLAVISGKTEAVQRLLKEGADIEAVDSMSGNTILMTACTRPSVEVVRILLDHHPSPYLYRWNSYGRDALDLAIMQGHVDIVRLLLERGAQVELSKILSEITFHCMSRRTFSLLLQHTPLLKPFPPLEKTFRHVTMEGFPHDAEKYQLLRNMHDRARIAVFLLSQKKGCLPGELLRELIMFL